MSIYNNKKIAIIGLSVEGTDCAKFFSHQGADITCCDRRTKEELGSTYETLGSYASRFQLGDDCLSNLDAFDLIVRSPGVSLRIPELVVASKKGIVITSATKIFFDLCTAPIIGVTGTKGKGTTSSLIYEILRKSDRKVWLGGNVGVPLLSQVRDILPSDIVVLELSSFQLEDLNTSPHIAAVLKVSQDHLLNFDPLASNYHESRDAYVEAKKSIVRYQNEHDFSVLNADDQTSVSFGSETKARKYYFSRSKDSVDVYVKNNSVFLNWQGDCHKICHASDIQLIGIHNLENIAAASLVSVLAGAPIAAIQSAVFGFKGLEHRLEFVRTVSGVSYYNDSFSTVPDTTIAAIDSFKTPLILIVGGSEKGSDFRQLGKRIATSKTHTLVVIGQMTQRIVDAVNAAQYTGEIVTGCTTMSEIVSVCSKGAVKGDTVLLSPACASFDMFKNYKKRGELFKHEVSLI